MNARLRRIRVIRNTETIKQADTNDDGKLSYRELQAACKKAGLPARGTTEELEQRLIY